MQGCTFNRDQLIVLIHSSGNNKGMTNLVTNSEVKGTEIPGYFKSNAAELLVQKVLVRHKKQQKVNESTI